MANNVFPPRPPFPPAPPRGRSVPPPPPGVMQYIGARYVPIFADPIEWQPNKLYEPLTIVTYNNSSYTSKQTVPAGASPDNGEYWVETGNFNAQINDLTTKIDGWDEEIAANTQTANEAKDTANAAQQAVADLDLTGLQQSVADAIKEVDDLKPLVQDNTGNIATNTAAISQNETDIAKNATDIANLQAADTSLGNRVTAAENNIQTAQDDITQAQTDINQNTTNIAANTSAISGLTGGLADANTDITALQTDVAKNTADISTANTNIAGMQSQVDTATGQIQTIKDQSDAATAEVERLTGIVGDDNSGLIKDFNDLKQAVESGESVEALAGRVGLIETQVGKPASGEQPATGLEKKVADNTAAIASSSSSISANTAAIGDNAKSITDLETQVGHDADGTTPATGLVKEINDIKASIGTVGNRLDTLDSDVSALKTTVGDSTGGLVKDVTDNMGDIAALQADVSTIQGQQTAQDTAINGNTTAISNAVTRISAVETGKQDKLSVDNTLDFTPTENPSNLSVKLPSVSMTKAQYDALKTKEDKLYIITDSDESGGSGSAGVSSFNGRTGPVLPKSGDYTADMVGAIPSAGGNITGDLEFAVDGTSIGGIHSTQGKYLHLMQSPTGASNQGSALWFPVSDHTADEEYAIQIAGVDTPTFKHDAANKLYVDSSIVRQNLLDNAYFLNPVNQRGQTVYQGGLQVMQYTIDRWRAENATVTVENDGLKIYGEATYGLIRQFYENPELLSGKTMTVSVLYPGNTVPIGSYIASIDSTEEFWKGRTNDANLQYMTFTVNDNITAFSTVLVTSTEANKTVKPIAVKLEIGNTQTLAHKEGDTWVLNEIPDYATELLKCKRYFQKYAGGWNTPVKGKCDVQSWGSYIRYGFYFPVSMRTSPTITVTDIEDVSNQNKINFSAQPTFEGNEMGISDLYWPAASAPEITNEKYYSVAFNLSSDL